MMVRLMFSITAIDVTSSY